MAKHYLYFDTASTTFVLPEVIEAMKSCLGAEHYYANPSSAHAAGQAAAQCIADARASIAMALGCDAAEVIFTSGATEANNWALKSAAKAYSARGRHIVTSAIEHKSILNTCAALAKEGFRITYVKPNARGQIEVDTIQQALETDTILVSLMHVNNETGVIQPIAAVAELLAETSVLFHVDASQSIGKLPLDLAHLPIDLLSLSAHKFHGPKGVGCLIIRNRRYVGLPPLMHGGGQEFGLRSGTLATHQIVGLATALQLARQNQTQALSTVKRWRQLFLESLKQQVALNLHGALEHSSPYILNLSFQGIPSDALLNQINHQLALASGSACSSGAMEPSYVLRAMGVEGAELYEAIRISFSRFHTQADITQAVDYLVAAIKRIKDLTCD